VHVYTGTGERGSYAGDNSVYPDGFMFRTGVTTAVDAGGAGWRNFPDFKDRIIDRSRTRVLAMLNIVGHGMRGRLEQDLDDMQAEPTAEMALRHKGVIVGIKTAHYSGPEFLPVERAVQAGTIANIPIMVDFGRAYPERSIGDLMAIKLRPGDIYTHVYSGLRGELDPQTGHANTALLVGRKRGVLLDVGHGGGSFTWRVAVPIIGDGILPDTISTDLHTSSMNAGMKDMLNVMSKFLAMGLTLEEVIVRSTWNAARAIKQEQLGNLSVGSPADIAVLRVETGNFGFLDMYNARLNGKQKLSCEMTLRDGRIVYDLNGLGRPDWTTLPNNYRDTGDPKWDGTRGSGVRRPRGT
jgi:dihydroorotase